MDFEKIRPAVEEIVLDDIQKEKILNSCKNKKRKFNYKPIAGIAAAAAIITVVLVSPGFLFVASSPDKGAPSEDALVMENGKFDFYVDNSGSLDVNTSISITPKDTPLFEADEFHELYSVIPLEFSSLVSEDEYNAWVSGIDAEGGMAMVQFVEHFGISREDFEIANELYCERTFSYVADSPVWYDADIIYSSDREKIDGFYRK